MSLQENIFTVSYAAEEAIAQYDLVYGGSTNRGCGLSVPVSGSPVIGVCLNKATAAGQAVTVATGGIVKARAAGSIAVGAPVGSDGSGGLTDSPADTIFIGIAVTAAGASGEVIEVQWLGPWK